MQIEYITNSESETQEKAEVILKSLENSNLICLYGDLGSGKTTITQAIGKRLKISQRMVSPTFIILRRYKLQTNSFGYDFLFHIDLYRIEKIDEIRELGILDFIEDKKNLVIIEWADRMGEYLPDKRIDVRFEYIDDNKRKIAIKYC